MQTESGHSNFSPNYWRRLHYTADPFVTDQNQSYFISDAWQEYLDLLLQFLRYCTALVILSGKKAVGKTTLINEFITYNQTDADILLVNATDYPGVEHLLKLLHEKFAAPYDQASQQPIGDQIQRQIDFLKVHKAPRLLIIDDAQKLPLDMRQACLQIVQQQSTLETCLPIILVGTEELEQQYHALLTPKTAAQCLHVIELLPFTRQATADYLAWACAQVSDEKSRSPFTAEDIDTIYQATQGIVGQVNQSARNLLASKAEFGGNHSGLRKKIIWWALILLAIAIVLILYKFITRPPQLATTFTTPLAARQPDTSDQTATQQVGNMIVKDAAPVNSTPSNSSATTAVTSVASTPVNNSAEHSTATNAATTPTDENTSKNSADAEQVASPPQTTPGKIHKKVSKEKILTTHDKKLFATVMQKNLAIERQRVLAVDGKRFTLQLLASNNLQTIEKFIAVHQLQSTALVAPVLLHGQRWYLVLYGIFPSRAQAQQSLRQLSPQLQQLKPWVKTFASVHQAMEPGTHNVQLKK